MPRWTAQDYADYQAKRERVRARPVHEELKDVDRPKANHKTRKARVDEAVHPKFRVTVTLRVSDKLRRDGDGALTTLLDCLVNTQGRLRSLDP